MSAPKSVVKINKSGVTFTSSVDRVQWTIKELCRTALRDVARFVTRRFREEYYKHFKKNTGDAGKATKYNVIATDKTQYPRVEIGLKKGRVAGFYAYFQELGTSKTKRLGLMQKTVSSNITEIYNIEAQYLSALEDEAKALSMIETENEMEGDAED